MTDTITSLTEHELSKPRFYIMDLDNYNESFLKEIITWQAKKIDLLEILDGGVFK